MRSRQGVEVGLERGRGSLGGGCSVGPGGGRVGVVRVVGVSRAVWLRGRGGGVPAVGRDEQLRGGGVEGGEPGNGLVGVDGRRGHAQQLGQLGVVAGHDHVDPRVGDRTEGEDRLRAETLELRRDPLAVDEHRHAERGPGGGGLQLLLRCGEHDDRGAGEERPRQLDRALRGAGADEDRGLRGGRGRRDERLRLLRRVGLVVTASDLVHRSGPVGDVAAAGVARRQDEQGTDRDGRDGVERPACRATHAISSRRGPDHVP